MSGSKSSVPGSSASQAELVQMSVHDLPRPSIEGADAQQRTRSGRIKMLLVLLICAAPVIASYFTYYVLRPDGRTNYGELIDPQRAIPVALGLSDLSGQAVQASTLKGQWLFVAVGSGACDAQCEERLLIQRQLRETLGRDRDRMDKLWLVTDQLPVSEPLRSALGDAIVLRVSQADLNAWLQPAAGRNVADHLYVVDPLGNWMMRFPADIEPNRAKRDLSRLMRASVHWDRAGRP